MIRSQSELPSGQKCFQSYQPFDFSKKIAAEHGCDLAVPNGGGSGIGNVLIFTPLIEALGRTKGRPLRLLTAPLSPNVGTVSGEMDYPVWFNNPFIGSITDINRMPGHQIDLINAEQDNCCQFNHVIENICYHYGVRQPFLRPQIYLTREEQRWALEQLEGVERPVVALHPSGTTACIDTKTWGKQRWLNVIETYPGASFVQIGKPGGGEPDLGILKPTTTLRQAFALIWACDAFVGFDSSPMHVATAFQKPVLALWDAQTKLAAEESYQKGFAPAVTLRWGYPQNRNVMILGEKDAELVPIVLTWLRDTLMPLQTPYFTANNRDLVAT